MLASCGLMQSRASSSRLYGFANIYRELRLKFPSTVEPYKIEFQPLILQSRNANASASRGDI